MPLIWRLWHSIWDRCYQIMLSDSIPGTNKQQASLRRPCLQTVKQSSIWPSCPRTCHWPKWIERGDGGSLYGATATAQKRIEGDGPLLGFALPGWDRKLRVPIIFSLCLLMTCVTGCACHVTSLTAFFFMDHHSHQWLTWCAEKWLCQIFALFCARITLRV